MSLIRKILEHPAIQKKPPVLIDIGASYKIHPKWELISKHSICVAFDADERDFRVVEKEQSNFKKLYIYNGVVTDKKVNKVPFYLTKSPYCSSLLKPDHNKVKNYLFSDLFIIEKTVTLKSINLQQAFDELKIEKIDWFKTDSQGTDLRLFKSLNKEIRENIIVAEFEPGMIDVYEGEDKLFSVLEYFNDKNFWLSGITIKGTPRVPAEIFNPEFKGSIFKNYLKNL